MILERKLQTSNLAVSDKLCPLLDVKVGGARVTAQSEGNQNDGRISSDNFTILLYFVFHQMFVLSCQNADSWSFIKTTRCDVMTVLEPSWKRIRRTQYNKDGSLSLVFVLHAAKQKRRVPALWL